MEYKDVSVSLYNIVGPLCERVESAAARTARVTCASQEDYMARVLETTLSCESGLPGTVKWTPDEKTPNTVYYQVSLRLKASTLLCV